MVLEPFLSLTFLQRFTAQMTVILCAVAVTSRVKCGLQYAQ